MTSIDFSFQQIESSQQVGAKLCESNRNEEIMSFFEKLVLDLTRHRDAWPFLSPVDPKALDIPHYFDVVPNPMDLKTIKQNIKDDVYKGNYLQCLADICLVFNNCYIFNPPESTISSMGEKLQYFFLKRLEKSGYFTDEQLAFARNPCPMKYYRHSSQDPSPLNLATLRFDEHNKDALEQKRKIRKMYKKAVKAERHWKNEGSDEKKELGSKVKKHNEREAKALARITEPLEMLLEPFEGDSVPLSADEMRDLCEAVYNLPTAELEQIVQFIQRVSPMTAKQNVDDDVFVFDLDELDVRVLRHLQLLLRSFTEEFGVQKEKTADGKEEGKMEVEESASILREADKSEEKQEELKETQTGNGGDLPATFFGQ
eukprot:MONOS_14451.1-p1 / transcript=MONOS_14451.1 / gene=MONOS_14451 / organism=Monocercomonoides_exilis_PA203 / gene_product=unspecified product / transcript_product=unspecified product / location=Mono_scaffold01004:16883-18145(-) / protein_length=370 / sequence_SO=supercontig / SO=protein_coding / is_pseudo=false